MLLNFPATVTWFVIVVVIYSTYLCSSFRSVSRISKEAYVRMVA